MEGINFKRISAVLLAAGVLALSACGEKKNPVQNEAMETESEENSGQEALPQTEQGTGGQQGTDGVKPGETLLTEEEMEEFTRFIQRPDNYGFALCEFSAPERVNLDEVLYTGGGMAQEMTDEDAAVYLALTGMEEIYTDCFKLSGEDVNNFVMSKLGLTLDQMKVIFHMVYDEETDTYYQQAGDTNYMPFVCVGGVKAGVRYTIELVPDSDWIDAYGPCTMTLVKEGEEFRFVSNFHEKEDGAGEDGYRTDFKTREEAYAYLLRMVKQECLLPDGSFLVQGTEEEIMQNTFALADIDGDGREELLLSWSNTYTAGMVLYVWEYDTKEKEFRLELQEFPNVTFFDSGIAFAGWSHNHGRGDTIWPTSIYRYMENADVYVTNGWYVDSWNKALASTDYDGNSFPDELDTDGDGVLFAIIYKEEYSLRPNEYIYNQADYDALMEELIGGAQEIIPEWYPLLEDNIAFVTE